MNNLLTFKIPLAILGSYILYKLGLEVWCIVYGMMY